MNGLKVLRMIISPGPAYSPWADMVLYDMAIVSELSFADAAFTALGNDLSVEQLSHLSIGAEFARSSRMKWIFDSTDAELSYYLRFRNLFSSAAETRTMDWADLVATEPHDISPGRS